MTIEVRAFVPLFTVPGQLPIGGPVLAYVRPGHACFRFPDSLIATIISGTDTAHATIIRWTPDQSVYLAAVDSALQHGQPPSPAGLDSAQHARYPYDGIFTSIGEGVTFTPTDASGWSTTFPASPQHQVPIAPAEACILK